MGRLKITASRLELFSKNNKRTCPFIREVRVCLLSISTNKVDLKSCNSLTASSNNQPFSTNPLDEDYCLAAGKRLH